MATLSSKVEHKEQWPANLSYILKSATWTAWKGHTQSCYKQLSLHQTNGRCLLAARLNKVHGHPARAAHAKVRYFSSTSVFGHGQDPRGEGPIIVPLPQTRQDFVLWSVFSAPGGALQAACSARSPRKQQGAGPLSSMRWALLWTSHLALHEHRHVHEHVMQLPDAVLQLDDLAVPRLNLIECLLCDVGVHDDLQGEGDRDHAPGSWALPLGSLPGSWAHSVGSPLGVALLSVGDTGHSLCAVRAWPGHAT